MSAVQFPAYVERFIGEAMDCFKFLKCSVALVAENPNISVRQYSIDNPSANCGSPGRLLIHRTARSIEAPIAEYRARYIDYLPPDFPFVFYDGINRHTSCAAVTANEGRISTVSQCIIDENYTGILAALLPIAAINSIPSMVRWAQAPASPTKSVSEWTDIDFEQLQYDWSHFGCATLYPRGIECRGGKYTLSLSAVDDYAMWGGGLLSLLAVPRSHVELDGQPLTLNDLNTWDFMLSDAPTFGAWTRNGDDYLFATFIPNSFKGLPQLADHLLGWAATRSLAVKSYVETMHLLRFDHDALVRH